MAKKSFRNKSGLDKKTGNKLRATSIIPDNRPKEEATEEVSLQGLEEISTKEALAVYELIKDKLELEKKNKIKKLVRGRGGRPKNAKNKQKSPYSFRANDINLGKLRIIAAYRNKKLGTLLNEIIEGYVKENYKPNMKDVVSKRRGEI